MCQPCVIYWCPAEGLSGNKKSWRYNDPNCRLLYVADLPDNKTWIRNFFGVEPGPLYKNPVHCWVRCEVEIETGEKSNKGNLKKAVQNQYRLKSHREALECGAIDRVVTEEMYLSEFTTDNKMKAMQEFRDKYPQPNQQYSWWPVAAVELGQMWYLQDYDGNLLSRDFTREVLHGVPKHELKQRYPDDYGNWDQDKLGREPTKEEQQYQKIADDWKSCVGNAQLVCCVMQLGYENGCSPGSWGLNAVAGWLYKRDLLPKAPPAMGIYRPLYDGRGPNDRDGGPGGGGSGGSHQSRLLGVAGATLAAANLGTAAAMAECPAESAEDNVPMVMMASTGIDSKAVLIAFLILIIVVESLTLLILALSMKNGKFSVIVDARQKEMPRGDPIAEEVPEPPRPAEAPEPQEAEEPPRPAEEPEEDYPNIPEPPYPPRGGPPGRIMKNLAVAPTGMCFHNLECPTMRVARRQGTARILRGCNQCYP